MRSIGAGDGPSTRNSSGEASFNTNLDLTNPVSRGVITFHGNPGDYIAVTLQERIQENGHISNIKITLVAPDGSICDGDKYFWVQAESMAAAALGSQRESRGRGRSPLEVHGRGGPRES